MNQDRLKQLLQFYEEDPDDPFNIYALANEYKNSDSEKALQYFEKLEREHPNYMATYYHLAHLYIDLREDEKAKSTFEKGMEIAMKNNEPFALRELRSAYEEFTMDD
jgi:Tfp pilus assembly protein PilF